MSFVLSLLWFLIFIKILLFWLWLWQLKEYHLGRFFAHFEAQKFKKIVSSLWRPKYPQFTKKIIFIFFACLGLEIFLLFYFPLFLAIILTIFFIPPFVFSFQIPSRIWRIFLLKKAREKRKKFKDLIVIGITGSYGKTSTKEFLAQILSQKFKVLKTKAHQNSEFGISQCILNDLKKEHEIFIVEMGAYNRGGIKLLSEIVKPKIGILTGINEQHLATFGSLENIIKGKYELIESLPKDGLAFFNGKNKYCRELYHKTKIKKFLFGENAPLGLENIEGAKMVAKELGMSDEEISRGFEKIKNKIGGMEIKKGIDGFTLIDATYSANPDGVIMHLEYLKNLPGKKLIVMPCLIELGYASKEIHKRIGQKIAEVCDLAIITTQDRFREIKEGGGEKVFFEENPKKILKKIRNFCQGGDTILLEGRIPPQLSHLLIKRNQSI